MSTPAGENHPQAQPTQPLPAPPAPPQAPTPPNATQRLPLAPAPAASFPPPHAAHTAWQGGPTPPHDGTHAGPHPADPLLDERRAERKRRIWIPVTSAAAAAALVAAAATFGLTYDDDPAPAASSSSFGDLGRSTTDVVPVAGSTSDDPDWQAVAAAVQQSVVAIDTKTASGEALGSGVLIDDQGHIVTNNHVVAGAQDDTVAVTLTDGRIFSADVVGTDPTTDLAVIRLVDPPSDLSPAALGVSADVEVGESVMAVGNPLGLQNTVTTGIVSAVDRPVTTQGESDGSTSVTNAIQVDASVNPGNSGGPLFDAAGHVIGINSSIATLSSQSGSIGLGFAIPVDLVKNIASQLIENGTAEHAFLGVGLDDGTATVDGVTRAGAVVKQVNEGSPAAEAGLATDDVVVGIDGHAVGGAESLTAYVRSYASGDRVTLTVVRDGASRDVEVTLATREDTGTGQAPDQDGRGDGQGDQGTGPDQEGQAPDDSRLPDGLSQMTPEELWQWLQEHQGSLGDQG